MEKKIKTKTFTAFNTFCTNAAEDSNLYFPAAFFRTLLRVATLIQNWCRLWDSNSRPTAYKAVALPTELNRQITFLVRYREA
jgi:hypothetical protein